MTSRLQIPDSRPQNPHEIDIDVMGGSVGGREEEKVATLITTAP